ncbi:hypothetical protein K7432_009651 [Basidiobolus ranarum]
MSTETQISRQRSFEENSYEDPSVISRASPSPELPMRSLNISPKVPSLPPRNSQTDTAGKAPVLPNRPVNAEKSPNSPALPPRNPEETSTSNPSKNPFLQDYVRTKPVFADKEIPKIFENSKPKPAETSPAQSSSHIFPPRSISPTTHSSSRNVPAFLSSNGVKRSNTTANTFLSKSAIKPESTPNPIKDTLSSEVPTKSFSTHRSTHSFSGIQDKGFRGVGSPNRKFNLGGGGDICPRCQKTVYAAESAMGAGVKYHKLCLRCSECSRSLDSTNMREREGTLYCKPCYAKLYGPKGYGYGEGAAFLTTEGAV